MRKNPHRLTFNEIGLLTKPGEAYKYWKVILIFSDACNTPSYPVHRLKSGHWITAQLVEILSI